MGDKTTCHTAPTQWGMGSGHAAADTAPRIAYVDTPQAIRDKYQYFTEARMKRLRAAGYPGQFTPLEEGVRRYVRDFLATDDPYR